MGGRWASRRPLTWLLAFVLSTLLIHDVSSAGAAGGYYGKFLGKLNTLHHSVSGDVYAVDSRTLHIRDFNYDGEAPDAFFYAGTTKNPSGSGFRIRDEKGTLNVLGKYKKKHVTLTLPEGKSLANIRWFSVWCREFEVNFADVRIPPGFDFPKPLKIAAIDAGIHGVKSDPITVVDAQTLLVPNFSYDGEAPDAKFWAGRGERPDSQGIRVADENGRIGTPLRRYDRRTLVLTLPGDLTVFDIGHFGVWCEAFAVDFGHVSIPRNPNVPPSLRMLGVSPQSKLNCEVLSDQDGFEVRWAVAGHSLVMQLVAKLDNGEYMSFGVSGEEKQSKMIGGDVVVAWLDSDTFQGRVEDYFLEAKSQCSGSRGSCPDVKLQEGSENSRLLSAARSDGHTVITYQRPLQSVDHLIDRAIFTNGTKQPFIWAIGPLNARNEVSYHRIANRHDVILDFGRYPEWNCPRSDNSFAQSEEEDKEESGPPATTAVHEEERPSEVQTPRPVPKVNAWKIPPIPCYEPDDGVYYAQMGPTGGKRGYPAITGHVGWGISWYINGLLIPEINVVRGRTYTFVVEGGSDPDTPARYHPLYITDDPVGGYQYKTEAERAGVQVFAGVEYDPETGDPRPTATGRLCNWIPDPDKPADEATSFGAYQRTLSLVCDDQNQGLPGILRWTPDVNTPDTVYYQCYTHRYLGWKINVLDSCETPESLARQQHQQQQQHQQRKPSGRRGRGRARQSENASRFEDAESLVPRASIMVSTRVRPDGAAVGEKSTNGEPNKPQIRYVEIQRNVSKVVDEGAPSVELTAPHAGVSEKVLLPERKTSRVSTSPARRFPPHQRGSSFTKGFRPNNFERKGTPHRGLPPRTSFSNRGEIDGRKRGGGVRVGGFHPKSEGAEVASRRTPAVLLAAKAKKKIGNRQVESLEPIFVPSPPDLLQRNGTSVKDTAEEETNMEANERVNSYSLPPKPQSAKVVSYDGKTIDPSLTSVGLPEREGSPRSARPIQNTPQFGPFLGEAPPPVPADVVPASLPQLRPSERKSESLLEPPQLETEGVEESGAPKRKAFSRPRTLREFSRKASEERRSRREAHHEPGHVEDPDQHQSHEDNHLKMNSKKCEGKECEGKSSSAAFVANVAILMMPMAMRQLL